MMMMMMMMMTMTMTTTTVVMAANAADITDIFLADKNHVYDPCSDTMVGKSYGFSLGLAFSSKESFFFNNIQLSPCDTRLSLATKSARVAVFRPKLDEISLLTINTTTFSPIKAGGYMVAFAGRKYAARSPPAMVADNTNTITSFTLVVEFQKGTLVNLYWKSFGCDACGGDSICLNKQDCAVPTSQCDGSADGGNCSIGIQLAFSGTDVNLESLNSWYEVSQLRQYSLYALFSDAAHDQLSGLVH